MLTIKTTGLAEFMDPSGEAYIKALIMGEAGVGKTPFAARWPKPIFADCENGLMSVAKLGVPYASINSSTDMDQLIEHLRRDSQLPKERRRYQTLVVDTFDSYQRKLIQERLKSERKETFSGHGDWGWLDAKMTRLIEQLQSLNINVVCNLHVKDVEDGDDDNRIQVKRAKLKGDVKDSIWQEWDLIGLMEKSFVMEDGQRVIKRQIRWHSEPRFPNLRDRSGSLPRFTDVAFTDRDFWEIFETIVGATDGIAEGQTLEQIIEESTAEVAQADRPGGPVEAPALPKTPPAKKAAAKKAAPAAKKTAAPKAGDPEPVAPDPNDAPMPTGPEDPALPAEEPAAEPAEPATDVPDSPEERLLKQELGAETVATEAVDPWTGKELEKEHDDLAKARAKEEAKAAKAQPEQAQEQLPEPAKAAAPAAKACGSQPPTMTKYPAAEGCGNPLDQVAATKSAIAVVKYKTYLCDDCFARAQAA